jgi:hypothetical protein
MLRNKGTFLCRVDKQASARRLAVYSCPSSVRNAALHKAMRGHKELPANVVFEATCIDEDDCGGAHPLIPNSVSSPFTG